MPRHKKFSSIGRDLTKQVNDGYTYKTGRKITYIAVHCSFSPQGRGDNADNIDAWHYARWGSGCGYHYIVLEDGTIQKGRWVDYMGSHVKGYNSHSIGICRIGGMGKDGKAVFDATEAQETSIKTLSTLLADMYDLDTDKILGHNEYPLVNKSCPLMDMNSVRKLS